MYVASKSGLQGAFKSLVCKREENRVFSAYILGIVDIEYKFLHKLSKTDPIAFDEILGGQVPTLNFASKSDISNFVYDCSENQKLCNGMIADITGGASWLIK